MQVGRKGAIVLLVMMVLGTVMPALACLPTMQQTGQQACCCAMVARCEMPTMNGQEACCQVDSRSAVFATVAPSTLEPMHKLAPVSREFSLPAPASTILDPRNLHVMPPIFPPGGSSILRI